MVNFSHRTDWPGHQNRISELADSLRSDADFIDLTESNPTRCGFDFLKTDWLDALKDPANLQYSPDPRGLKKAREAVAGYYADKKIKVDPDQILLTSGTSEGYNFLLRLLTHPGEAVMTPAPSYPLIDLLLDLNDIRQHRYPLTYNDPDGKSANGWKFDVANARQARLPQTRALMTIHPHNPTGHSFIGTERDAMVEFTRSENMALIVDEVFLDYAQEPAASFASEDRVLTFTLSGISKVLALPQMKLSWIVVSGPESERTEAMRRLEIIADTFLSVNAPAQNALSSWLTRAPQVHAEIRSRIEENHRTLEKTFQNHPALSALRSSGAWTAILRHRDNSTDDETLAFGLLGSQKVLTHPGFFYDFAGGQHLVLSLLPPADRFEVGIERLAAHFRK